MITSSSINTAYTQAVIDESFYESPLDTTVIYGRLSNGFQYFIKNIDEADSKLHLRLYSKAGINLERKDQLNISHAVEHLAFKSSKNFPEGIKGSPLLSKFNLGMMDIVAYNGTKLTQYIFTAPSKEYEALKVGLLWFKDITSSLSFLEKDISQVRGELRQEFITRIENYGQFFSKMTMYSKIFPCLNSFKNFEEFEKQIDPVGLRNFYRDWYRPDLFAIAIVGNIDNTSLLEESIKKKFSNVKSPENTPEKPDCEKEYFRSPPQFSVIERPLDSVFNKNNIIVDVHLFYRDPELQKNIGNISGLQRLIEREMLKSVISKRLRKSTNRYNAPLLNVDDPFKKSGFPPTLEILLSTEDDEIKTGLQKVMLVLKQLAHDGVSEDEWKEEKGKQLRSILNRDPNDPTYWINEIKEHYNTGEALPANKNQHLKTWLKKYSMYEFNAFVNDFLSKEPEDIGIVAPYGHKALSYTEDEVRSWLNLEYGEQVDLNNYLEKSIYLMSQKDIATLKENKIQDLGTGVSGAREFVLNNGIKLVLINSIQATTNSRDGIMVQGFSKKGANCFPKSEFHSIINSPSIVLNSGVGGLDKFEINRYFANKGQNPVTVSTYIDSHESGIQATTTQANLEDVFQLIYLHFTEPNKSKEAFDDWKSIKNRELPDLRDYFRFKLEKLSGNESVVNNVFGTKGLRRGIDPESYEETELNVSHRRFKHLFSQARDFTFIISGNYELETLLPLVNKYLGNLPNRSFTCNPQMEVHKANLKAFNVIEAPRPNNITYTIYGLKFMEEAKTSDDWKERLKIEALGEITREMAWSLRFEKSYSLYMVWVGGKKDLLRNHYEIGAIFECIPEEYQAIKGEFASIISTIKSGNVPEAAFQKGMKRIHSKYRNSENRLGEKLYEHYRYNHPWEDLIEAENYIGTITKKEIVETANKIYQEENLFEYVMDVK